MKEAEAEKIQREVNTLEDVKKHHLPYGLTTALLIQKSIKNAKKYSWKVQKHFRELKREWQKGADLIHLAGELELQPLGVAFGMREFFGLNKKSFHRLVHELSEGERNPRNRIEKEITAALKVDFLGAPKGFTYMRDKGIKGEEIAKKILESHGVQFKREKEQPKGGKTPDFLFAGKKILWDFEATWFESKATFANMDEAKEDYRTQLKFYMELFGPGIVSYWFGYTDEAREFLESKGIKVLSGEEVAHYAPEDIKHLKHGTMEL